MEPLSLKAAWYINAISEHNFRSEGGAGRALPGPRAHESNVTIMCVWRRWLLISVAPSLPSRRRIRKVSPGCAPWLRSVSGPSQGIRARS